MLAREPRALAATVFFAGIVFEAAANDRNLTVH